MESTFNLKGKFKFECFDKDGNLKWEKEADNAATDEGLNSVLNVYFHAATQISTWYIGLITGTGTLNAADTLASHAGWTEGTDYTGNRLEWTEGAASSQSITNGTAVDFPITGTMTVKGAFLSSAATGTTGTLFCTAAFTGGDQVVGNGDTLKVTYTVTAAAA